MTNVGRVDSWFERQARLTPDAPAIIVAGRVVSYRAVDRLANGIAQRLADGGVGRGALVGVLLERDERLIAALLGVLKAGAAYVPLDPAYPAQRLRFVAADTGMRAVLTCAALCSLATETALTPALVDDVTALDSAPATDATADDPAYVIYTSGSSGQPKGVVVEHRCVANLLGWSVVAFSAEELSGVLAATSVCFDVSVVELFTPLVTGGTIVMAESLLALPHLADRDRVRLVFGVPSALSAVVQFAWPAGIRTVVPAGEALPRALADRLYAQPGVDRVVNCFGPTECTVYCAAAEVARAGDAAPAIGLPVAKAELSVRDPKTGRPVPAGDPGELWVAGPGLARGYLHRPELTAEHFIADAGRRWYRTGDLARVADGAYQYLGRLDDQVKIRGHRVEPGELQATLAAHPAVQQAAVLAPTDEYGIRHLIGYVVPVTAALTEAQLREWLRSRLPGYLLPSQLVFLEALPLGPTGKVERAALPAPLARRTGMAAPVAPTTATEAMVAEVVADVLGLPEVGVTDRFGDLGGHSLAAARVVATVAARLERSVPVSWFLEDPTVAALAHRMTTTEPERRPSVTAPVRHDGQLVFPLTDLQREFWVTRQVHPGVSTTVAIHLHLTGGVRSAAGVTDATPAGMAAAVAAALSDLVRRHEVLRTGFEEWDDGPVAVVRPPAPVPLTQTSTALDGDVAAVTDTVGHVFNVIDEVPLLRAALVHTGPGEADLVLAVDHMAFDGYSIGVLMTELAAALAGQPVAQPVLQVGDFGLYERALADDPVDRARLRAFWRATLARVDRPAELTGAGRRAAKGARVVRLLDADLVGKVDETVRGLGVSRFAGYTAALAVLLNRITGDSMPVIGTGAALRDLPGLDRAIGPLVRVLPVLVDASGDPSFRELSVRAAAAAAGAVSHQGLATEELARCAAFDRPPGAGLCPVILTMQPEGMPTVVAAGPVRVALVGELAAGMASADLAFFINHTVDGTQVQVEYDVGLYRASDVDSLLDLWLRVLGDVVRDPAARISTIEPPRLPDGLLAVRRSDSVPNGRASSGPGAIEPVAQAGVGGPPASELERFVAEVWAEVLDVPLTDIGRESEFFTLGGNSFAATRVVARLRAVLECHVPVRALFERSVLADFASEVEHIALTQLSEVDEWA